MRGGTPEEQRGADPGEGIDRLVESHHCAPLATRHALQQHRRDRWGVERSANLRQREETGCVETKCERGSVDWTARVDGCEPGGVELTW